MSNFKQDVIDRSPLRNTTDVIRDIALLAPEMRAKVNAVIADAATAGHRLIVLETYRSEARQAELFRSGATELEHVGVHGYGLACDLAFLGPDGKVNWSADYSVLGNIARGHGLVWGGDWGEPAVHHTFHDDDHLQWCAVKDQPRLFDGSWYPAPGYDALARP